MKGKGEKNEWTVHHAGESNPIVNQRAAIGVGIPIVGDATLSIAHTYNDPNVGDEVHGGLDVDAGKFSFAIKCIIGFEFEINADFIEGNTFVKCWDALKESFNSSSGDK